MRLGSGARSLLRRLRGRARVFAPHRALRAAQLFIQTESAGGVALLAASLAAIAWANSPLAGSYSDLWKTTITLDVGLVDISDDLVHWVNDGLMTAFFFLAGLEIKRELVHGELTTARRARLPVIAALGGMMAPALIFYAFNHGGPGARGWGIPMATDIAFSLGMLSLLGRRVPIGVKVFLLAFAIVDDIGSIAVIALFYSGEVGAGWLLGALGLFLAIAGLNRSGFRTVSAYVCLGAGLWVALHESGVTPTLAGVALGLLTPATSVYDPRSFPATARGLIDGFRQAFDGGDKDTQEDVLGQIEDLTQGSEAPLERLERTLHPWVAFLVVPVFALANVGIDLSADVVEDAGSSPVAQGILVARLAGKLAGIVLFTYLAVRLRLCDLPTGATWRHIGGVGLIASVGFTVSILVANQAFTDEAQIANAKIGLFAASAVAAVLGYAFLRLVGRDTEPAAS